jgi:hypothetical protein
MPPDLLHVVCMISNPIRWKSRIRLYNDFEQHMLDSGVRLTTVEISYGARFAELTPHSSVNHIKLRADGHQLCWQKESALNIGIYSLPPDAKYIATIDADIRFRRSNWASETIHALQHYHVVQPWADCYDLGPNDEHLKHHVSFCRLVHHKEPIEQGPQAKKTRYRFGHSGYAWGWTRQALEWTGGLIETAALGSADHHMAMALIGRVDDSIHRGTTPAYRTPLVQWQQRAMRHIAKNIGYVPGTIEHAFHGPKAKRFYMDRWEVLARHAFDPTTDLKRNTFGLIELAGSKPGLRHDIDLYFRSRDEDATTLS